MSFLGTLVVWHRPQAGVVAPDILDDLEAFQTRGEWTVSYLDDELIDADAHPLLDELCAWTAMPTLTTFIFESDCGFISAAHPNGDHWIGCFPRDTIAALESLDEPQMLRRYGSPTDTASHAAAWAHHASLTPNHHALETLFAEQSGDTIFQGISLFNRMLDALGLPAKATFDFYDPSDD